MDTLILRRNMYPRGAETLCQRENMYPRGCDELFRRRNMYLRGVDALFLGAYGCVVARVARIRGTNVPGATASECSESAVQMRSWRNSSP